MNNVIPLHQSPAAKPEWFGPEDITIGADKNGERLEATIDQNDDGQTVLIIPPTTFTGRVGYTLTDEQAAELTGALHAAMSPAARALFHQQLGASS